VLCLRIRRTLLLRFFLLGQEAIASAVSLRRFSKAFEADFRDWWWRMAIRKARVVLLVFFYIVDNTGIVAFGRSILRFEFDDVGLLIGDRASHLVELDRVVRAGTAGALLFLLCRC
jgi:hypothetical protein